MTGPYNAEFHARRTAVVVQEAAYVIIHDQNVDGTWTQRICPALRVKEYREIFKYYTVFHIWTAYKYIFYYWTNGENDFTIQMLVP